MSEAMKIADFMKALPSGGGFPNKYTTVSDAQGKLELYTVLSLKCFCLFGIGSCVKASRDIDVEYSDVVRWVHQKENWWSEFNTVNAPVGIIASITFNLKDTGRKATLYYLCLDKINIWEDGQTFRMLRPLMLEIPGYAPIFSSVAPEETGT